MKQRLETMKNGIFVLGLLMSFQSNAQIGDSCFVSNLKIIEIFVHLKGYPYNDSIYVKSDSFEKGLELVSPNSVKILGFRVLFECPGCDIVEFDACGNAIPTKYLKMLNTLFKTKEGWLGIHNINIEISGRRYLAPQFTVFPIK